MGAVRCDLGRDEAMVMTYAIGYFMGWKTARGASSLAKPALHTVIATSSPSAAGRRKNIVTDGTSRY